MTWRQTEQEDMIKRITIRDVASYDHEGCTFDDLAKVNIIYGGNGTGKTTLSKMSGLQRPEGEYENCLVERDAEFDRLRVFMKGLMEHFLREESQGSAERGGDGVAAYGTIKNLRIIEYGSDGRKEKEEEQGGAADGAGMEQVSGAG